ncbi:hypothetical protein LIER_16590 [Lithospermum erythrorhizon]|uniref:Uncharacterized protein n=1 Tax=Lithospermum erythrorhizon TaxID=34254 RepID=A0AAV3Q8T3_LITER
MVDAINDVNEIDLDDVIGTETASDISTSSNDRLRRGYDLPTQRKACQLPKMLTIFQNILRPDDIPRWFCPEIRYRFLKLWPTFEVTANDFRDKMWESFNVYKILLLC